MIHHSGPPHPLLDLLESALPASRQGPDALERRFAEHFEFPHGLLFATTQGAVQTLLETRGGLDVACPAYTRPAIPRAIHESGCRPRFADSAQDHFNVPRDQLEASLTPETGLAILTPIFGYPIDRKPAEDAIRERSPHAFMLYDMARGFLSEDRKGSQLGTADGALFELAACSVLLVRDDAVAAGLRAARDAALPKAGLTAGPRRLLRGLGAWSASWPSVQHLLDRVGARPAVNGLRHPPGRAPQRRASGFEARLGLRELAHAERRAARRWASSQRYEVTLQKSGFLVFPTKGVASYSRFPLAVNERDAVVDALAAEGVLVGIPDEQCWPSEPDCPHARWFERHLIHLPNWTRLTARDIDAVVTALERLRARHPEWFPATVPKPAREPRALPTA